MSIIGKWKIKSIIVPDFSKKGGAAMKEINSETIVKEDREMQRIFNVCFFFEEDHTVHEKVALPEGVKLSDLKPKEREKVKDGFFEMSESKNWKEEGGKYYLDTKTKGEILGEKVSPWVEIEINEDGTISWSEMIMKFTLERI